MRIDGQKVTVETQDDEQGLIGLLQQGAAGTPFNIEYETLSAATIESVVQLANTRQLRVQLTYTGNDENKRDESKKINTQLNDVLAAKYTSLILGKDNNILIMCLKPGSQTQDGLEDIADLFTRYEISDPVRIGNVDDPSLLTKEILALCKKDKLRIPLITILSKKNTIACNKKLHDYHYYITRKIPLNASDDNRAALDLDAKPAGRTKVRRSKLAYQQHTRSSVRTQQQFLHQQDVAANRQQAMQRQQVAEKQRQSQEQRHQERQQLIQQHINRQAQMQQVNAQQDWQGNYNNLLTRSTLSQCNIPGFSTQDLEEIWDNLVGKHATYVETASNRITHVPRETFELIVTHRDQFSDGVHFDNLPNGFQFIVKPMVDDSNHEQECSILYFDPELIKTASERVDTPLAAQLREKLSPIEDFKDVGQFYPFNEEHSLGSYETFCKDYQNDFNRVFSKVSVDIEDRRESFATLIQVDADLKEGPEVEAVQALLKDLSDENLDGLRCILHSYGADTTIRFLQKVNQLPDDLREQFKRLFLDEAADWRAFIHREAGLKDELTPLSALDHLSGMSITERAWWKHLVEQHCETTPGADFCDLVNAHKYFFEQIKAIDQKLELPLECPLKIKNMKTAYDRVLYVLKKAVEPLEQVKHLALDWSMQGVICAMRPYPYVFVHEDQQLTPESGIVDWEKYRHLIPSMDPNQWTFAGNSHSLYLEYLVYCANNQLPQACKAPLSFHTGSYVQATGLRELMEETRNLGAVTGLLHMMNVTNTGMAGLDRGPNGRLRTYLVTNGEATVDYYHSSGFQVVYKDIPDEKLQDTSIMTRENKLSYYINLPKLQEMTEILSNYESTWRYFYRYIGTQFYAFPLEQYRRLLNLLSNEDRIDSNLQKSLLLFLAATTVGERAYKADENNEALLTQMIADAVENSSNYQNREDIEIYVRGDHNLVSKAPEPYYIFDKSAKELYLVQHGEAIKQTVSGGEISSAIQGMENNARKAYNSTLSSELPFRPRDRYKLSELDQLFRSAGSKHQPLNGKLQRMNEYLVGASHTPTLSEAFTLLKLPTNLEIERLIFDAIEQQGPVIYTVMANFAHQHPHEDPLSNLCKELTFNEPVDPKRRQIILLLSSFLPIDKAAAFLGQATTKLSSLNNDFVLTYLLDFLEKVDFKTHTGEMASSEQIEKLIQELSLIEATDEGVKASVHKLVVAAFPNFKFNDVAVSSEIADLIRFFGQWEGLLGSFKEEILACVPTQLPEELTGVIGQIAAKTNEKLQPVSDSLTQIWRTADKKQIPDALKHLKAFLMFSMNPAEEIQFDNEGDLSRAVKELMPAISTKLLEAIRTDLLVPALGALDKAYQQEDSNSPAFLAATIKKIKETCYQKVRTPFDVLDQWLRNPEPQKLDVVLEHFDKLLQFSADPTQGIEENLNPLEKLGVGLAKQMMNDEIQKLRNDPTIEPPTAGLIKTIEDTLTVLIGGKSYSLIEKMKARLVEKIDMVERALKGIKDKTSPSQEELNVALDSFHQLFLFTETPFEGIEADNFSENAQLLALKFIVTPLIKRFRDRALDEFTGPWYNGVMAEVARTVERLNFNDALLNAEGEEQDLISAKFQTFLAAQIPALDKDNLITSINDILSASKNAHDFLKTFDKWENRTARDLLARALYRHGYFQTKPPSPSLVQVSKLATTLREWADFIMPELLNDLLITKDGFNETHIGQVCVVLDSLRNDKADLTQEQFNRLLKIGLNNTHGKSAVEHLLTIKKNLNGKQRGEIVFRMLLEASFNETISTDVLAKIKECLQTWPNETESVIALIEWARNSLGSIEPLLEYFRGNENTAEKKKLLRVLRHSCWEHGVEDERKTDVNTQIALIGSITNKNSSLQTQLFALYETPPSPGINALSNKLAENDEALKTWIQTKELDPFGAFDRIKSQFDPLGVKTFISEIVSLKDGEKLPPEVQDKLEKDYLTIISITHNFCVPVSQEPDAEVKPLKQFTHKELLTYYNDCVEGGKKVEALAALCLALFRTTGKYPYFSQIISALTTIQPGNVLLEIPTGQGKGITNALNAALAHSFGSKHVSVTTKNRLLAYRDFKELKGFYDYLTLPVQLVLANTEPNHFERPTIKYSTVPDESLYRSRLKMTDKVTFPDKDKQIHIGDESDSEFYDSKHAFNYSDSDEDPYYNPLEWVYPLVNEFTDSPLFNSNQVTEGDDILYFRAFLKSRDPGNFETFKQRLTDSKLDELLDASCSAKGLIENEDFLVRSIERDEYGTKKSISKANILVDHAEDPDATFSYGVQQCLHDLLNQTYKQEIDGEERPAFSCDNQIDSVDSQFYYSYFQQFGRLICSTATAGSPEELTEVQKTLNFETMLSIPKRKRGLLNHLDTIFTDDNSSCFFSSETQKEAIIRKLDASRERPVLLKLKNIETANDYYETLKIRYGDNVQVIHAGVAENQQAFEEAVKKAGDDGMITVVTPLVGRGVDIKTTSNLLVIETEVERVRSGRQYQGRTARDDNPGEVINILNLEDIETTHSESIKHLSRKEKIQRLRKITQNMDREAQKERVYTTQALAWKNRYAAWLDEQWVAQNNPAGLLDIKRDFLLSADKLWQTVLADSKEMQRMGFSSTMQECVDTYKTQLETRLNELLAEKNIVPANGLASDYQYTYNPNETLLTGRKEESSNPVSSSEPLYQMNKVYTDYLNETLLSENQNNSAFQSYGVACNSVRDLCSAITDYLALDKSLWKPSFVSEVQSFSDTLRKDYPASKMTPAEKIVQVLNDQGATPGLCYLVHDHMQNKEGFSIRGSQDEKSLVDGVMSFILGRLGKEIAHVDGKNQPYLSTLCTFLKTQKPTNLLEMQHLLLPVLNRLSERVQEIEPIAKGLKAVVDGMSGLVNAEPLNENTRNEIKADIIRQEIFSFLAETEERLSGKWYQIGKEHAVKKSLELCVFRENLKIRALGDEPFTQLEAELKRILQMNTRTGERNDEKTESWIAYKDLEARLGQELTNKRSIHAALKDRLDGIEQRLIDRGAQAKKNSFFKNSDLYDDKITNLGKYKKEFLDAVKQKEDKGIYDFDTEIHAFQRRVQHDPALNQSSSRFLKLFNNVTVVKEINDMTNEWGSFRV